MLKSDEKSEDTPLFIEIMSCEHFFTVKKVLHLFRSFTPRCVRERDVHDRRFDVHDLITKLEETFGFKRLREKN